MNIQKISMRPVICLLLVVLLISTFFSVSVFADKTGDAVSASGVYSYTSDIYSHIVKIFVPEFEELDMDYFAECCPLNPDCLFYLHSTGTVLIEESWLYNLSTTWDLVFSDGFWDVDSYIETSPSYRENGSTYYPIPCPQEAVLLSGEQAEFMVYPAESEGTEPTTAAVPDSTLSQAVSANSISAVLDQVLDLLPVVVGCIVGFVAIRKGLSFLESILHSA